MEILDVKYRKVLLSGAREVFYDCPKCGSSLTTAVQDMPKGDTCPDCSISFKFSTRAKLLVKEHVLKERKDAEDRLAKKDAKKKNKEQKKIEKKNKGQKDIEAILAGSGSAGAKMDRIKDLSSPTTNEKKENEIEKLQVEMRKKYAERDNIDPNITGVLMIIGALGIVFFGLVLAFPLVGEGVDVKARWSPLFYKIVIPWGLIVGGPCWLLAFTRLGKAKGLENEIEKLRQRVDMWR